jgi:hypothetical protein
MAICKWLEFLIPIPASTSIYHIGGGMTALHWAIVEHTKSLVLLLDCSRIDVNKKRSPGGWQSPLYQAVRFNSLHAVKLLLAHKDINISLLN